MVSDETALRAYEMFVRTVVFYVRKEFLQTHQKQSMSEREKVQAAQ